MRGIATAAVLMVLLLAPRQGHAEMSEYERAQAVSARQQLMMDLQGAYFLLLDVKNGKSSDYKGAAETAQSMTGIMSSFIALVIPATARGEVPGSRARPEVWSEGESFTAAAEQFQSQASALAEVATTSNAEAYAAAFGSFTAACTACHDFRPSSGGKFRYARDE